MNPEYDNARVFRLRWFVGFVVVLRCLAPACTVAEDSRPSGITTVVWVSIDGFRPDYLDRAPTPVLDRLVREGAHTRAMRPIFPSLTFPVHVSTATGVAVERHGIPSNAFYDRRRGRTYRYPPWAGMVEAEAIWNTVTRQGLRVAVLDWPLANAQRGENAAAYFLDRFDPGLSDRARLEALLRVWREDRDPQPLQLLATWIGDLDRAGHQYGPDHEEMAGVMARTDALLGDFVAAVEALWRERAGPRAQLFLLLTTDHGMGNVHTLVNLPRILEMEDRNDERVEIVTSANIGHVYFTDRADESLRRELRRRLVEHAGRMAGMDVYAPDELPSHWRYAHPHRTGDLVVVLAPGYCFSSRPRAATAPAAEFDGPYGMHGYDPLIDEDMLGFAVFWRLPDLIGGRALEAVHVLQMHPTIAALLGVAPAEHATAPPLDFCPAAP